MTALNSTLTRRPVTAYPSRIAETTASRFDSRNGQRRTTASRRYFFVRTPEQAFERRALAGTPSGVPVTFDAGLSTLPCARPLFDSGERVIQPVKGGRNG